MRSLFLAVAVLISAPVFADEAREFSKLLEEYRVFSDKRAVQSKSHSARFGSKMTFREDCNNFYMDDTCMCEPGNKYLQCLTSAQGVITVDPNDIGGRGYILVTVDGSALNTSGQWIPATTRGAHTAVIERLGTSHTVNIPIPDKATIDSLCAGSNGPISFTVAYGAVMPIEIEFARRVKKRSVSMGLEFNENEFIFAKARNNGSRARKGAVAGSVECHPPSITNASN